MKRKISTIIQILLVTVLFTACQSEKKVEYTKFQNTFFEYFDTVTTVIGYTKTEEEFNAYYTEIQNQFKEYNELYNIYNDYPGVNNIKTINENAGIAPVKVDQRIIDLILFSKEWYEKTNGKTNIAMGSVLSIWHDYRDEGEDDLANAKLPPMEELVAASEHMDINKVEVNEEEGTVYLSDPLMRLDVGSVAKGYATEQIGEMMREKGFTSLIISAGGNVKALDKPLDEIRDRWGIGIQNPDESVFSDGATLDTVFGNNISVVTSGDYQRYYVVGDKKYHHLIDGETLMPGTKFKAVSVVVKDSGLADFLSTTLFLSTLEEGKEILSSIDGAYAIWVDTNNEIFISDGFETMLKSKGASGADK
jgi:thiamine biosynthesis lipoprotein